MNGIASHRIACIYMEVLNIKYQATLLTLGSGPVIHRLCVRTEIIRSDLPAFTQQREGGREEVRSAIELKRSSPSPHRIYLMYPLMCAFVFMRVWM